MQYTRDDYELISSIESKLESIKKLSEEGIKFPSSDLENVKKLKNKLDEIEDKIRDIQKNSTLTDEYEFNKYISKRKELKKVQEDIASLEEVARTNGINNLNSMQSYIDLLSQRNKLEKETSNIESSAQDLNALRNSFDEYEAQTEELKKINSELLRIQVNSRSVTEETSEWNRQVRNVREGYQEFIGNISKSFGILKKTSEFWRKQDDEITKMVATFGMTNREFEQYRKTSYKIGIDMAKNYGKTQEDMVKLQQGYAEATGKNIVLTKENYDSQFQLQQLMGEENSLAFTSGIEQFGVNINDAKDSLYEIYGLNKKNGVSWYKTSKSLVENLKLAQKYNFQGGLKNMMEMTVWANKMKINLQTIGSLADKISNPESVIETAARLQVLGGEFSSMANPLQMLYESLDDVGGLAQRVEKMFSNLGVFDKELGQVTISGPDRLRVKAAAEAMGMQYEEAMEIINNRARRNEIEKQIRFNAELSDESKDLIQTIAQWNNKTKSFEVRTYNEDKQMFETKNINSLSEEDMKKLRQEPDDDIKKIVERTFSINQKAAMIQKTIEASKADYLDGFRNNVESIISTGRDTVASIDSLGAILVQISAMLAAIKLGMALKGAAKMTKGAGGIFPYVKRNFRGAFASAGGGKKFAMKAAGTAIGGAVLGGVSSYLMNTSDVNELKKQREDLIRRKVIEKGSDSDKELIGRIKHAEKERTAKAIGSAIGTGVGSLLYLVPGGQIAGTAGAAAGGMLGSGIGGAIVGDYENVDDGGVVKNKIVKANKDDSALFAKDNGPFDKLFGKIIPKIEKIEDLMSSNDINKKSVLPYKKYDINVTYSNNKSNTSNEAVFRQFKEENSYNSKIYKVDENNSLNSLISNVREYKDETDKINTVINKSYKNDKTDLIKNIVDVKPIGEEISKINEKNINNFNTETKINSDKKLNINPIDININGTLKIDSNGNQFDIIEMLKSNPIFLRELSKMLVTEMSNSIYGGKPKLNQNRFVKL